MYLPPSKYLNIDALSNLFSDMSESYKLFWFNSILEGVAAGKGIQSFDEIVNRMVLDAWPFVVKHRISLGTTDGLEELVKTIAWVRGLSSDALKQDVLQTLNNTNDRMIHELKIRLVAFVPYRLLAPFMPDMKGDLWKKQAEVISRINQDDDLIYSIGEEAGLARTIRIAPDWMYYLYYNHARISDWIKLNMLQYLQRRNPDIPNLDDIIRPSEY